MDFNTFFKSFDQLNWNSIFKVNEGSCPTHFLVLYKNRFFKIEAFHEDEKLLNISELYQQFKKIANMCKTDGVGIGALTGDYRDDWTDVIYILISYIKALC